MSDMKHNEIVQELRNRLEALPPGTASWHIAEADGGYDIIIAPSKPGSCSLDLFVHPIIFEAHFGLCFALENYPLNSSDIFEIYDIVSTGTLKETVWEWRGRILKIIGQMYFQGQNFTETRIESIFSFFVKTGTPRIVTYLPWENKENSDENSENSDSA